ASDPYNTHTLAVTLAAYLSACVPYSPAPTPLDELPKTNAPLPLQFAASAEQPPAEPDKKSVLRQEAMADRGVQALLEVFPAEISDVEELESGGDT
ncbi:hypothetical protein B4Q13_16010, partial [Lacticaseibacillus rhamnosus]